MTKNPTTENSDCQVIMRIVTRSTPNGSYHYQDAYLMRYDIEAHGGRGDVVVTSDKNAAVRFDNMAAALAAWRQQSKVKPLRDDGKPNRPLTALTIEFVEVKKDPG